MSWYWWVLLGIMIVVMINVFRGGGIDRGKEQSIGQHNDEQLRRVKEQRQVEHRQWMEWEYQALRGAGEEQQETFRRKARQRCQELSMDFDLEIDRLKQASDIVVARVLDVNCANCSRALHPERVNAGRVTKAVVIEQGQLVPLRCAQCGQITCHECHAGRSGAPLLFDDVVCRSWNFDLTCWACGGRLMVFSSNSPVLQQHTVGGSTTSGMPSSLEIISMPSPAAEQHPKESVTAEADIVARVRTILENAMTKPELLSDYVGECMHNGWHCLVNNRGPNKFEYALAWYNAALQLDSTSVDAYSMRGRTYNEKGEADNAIVDYTKAIKLLGQPHPVELLEDMKAPDAYIGRGDAYFKKGEIDKALADYTKAMELTPADWRLHQMALRGRATAYEALGRKDEAIANYRAALSIDSSDRDCLAGMERLGVSP